MMLYKSKMLLFLFLIWHDPRLFGNEIINGGKAKPGSLLYMAYVKMKVESNYHQCGGFLVSNNFVITAAHCNGEDMHVFLGTHNIKGVDESNKYKVTKQCKHPAYTKIIDGNDIMLLKLSRNVKDSKTLQPIQLAHQGHIVKENTDCLVAGWGMTKTSRQSVSDLNVVNVSTINRDDCQSQWQRQNVILPPDVICAGGYNSGKGFCQGDSGGPLVCDGKVAGVVSFNYNQDCNYQYSNLPNVYTSISNYLPWINNILTKNDC